MSERREKEADAEVAKNGPAGKLARVRVNLDRTADVVMRDHFHLVRTVDGSDIRENFRARGGRSIERGSGRGPVLRQSGLWARDSGSVVEDSFVNTMKGLVGQVEHQNQLPGRHSGVRPEM